MRQKIQDGAKAEYTIWGQSREYKRRPMLKILADHMMNHHMVAAAGGGRHHVVRGGRRPPLIMWSASISSIGLRLYFLLWPILYFQLWPLLYFQLWPLLYFLLWPHIVFSALAPYCIFSRLFYQLPCSFVGLSCILSCFGHYTYTSMGYSGRPNNRRSGRAYP